MTGVTTGCLPARRMGRGTSDGDKGGFTSDKRPAWKTTMFEDIVISEHDVTERGTQTTHLS